MDDIRIIHTGDTHLGYRQYHSEVRRQDFLDAFARVIDDAIAMKAAAVVHAGDLFDSRNPTLDDILETMKLFSRLKEAMIPLLAVVGNHESKQSTQWLDLYESMGLVIRLGATPYRLGNVAIYGIDHVPRSRIPLFDYSVFNTEANDAVYNLLVMHQMMKPFAFGEWDVQHVLDSLPFDVHAILLGDNHKHEIIQVGGTWVTYCGSTERNGASELEPRSYNIVNASDNGIEISKRVIPTRDFVLIPVKLSKDSQAYEEIFSAIKERDVEDKVVFVNISGDPEIKIKFSEIEEFLLSRKALVPGIKDLRTGEVSLADASITFSFADPDDAVKEEIRKMSLTQGGIMIDEIIRNPVIVKTRVDAEVEDRLGELLDRTDFTDLFTFRTDAALPERESDGSSMNAPEGAPSEAASTADVTDEDVAPPDEVDMIASEEDVCNVSEAEQGPLEEETGTEEQQHVISASKELPQKKVHKEPAQEKAGNVSPADKGHKAASKPRQYNLGDYL